jgi:molybdopterin-guanine dinucleotide biosynthesis protein A
LAVPAAGLLLTGGASRRLGVPKARLTRDGESLADRSARVLSAVCDPVLEVGSGASTLPSIQEEPAGEGPLVAMVAGERALRDADFTGPVLLLAVDLPFVESTLLSWLAEHPAPATLVPRVGGVAQSLCARYAPEAFDAAAALIADGQRSLRALLESVSVTYVDEAEWSAITDPRAFQDVDTPSDAARAGLQTPG